MYRILLERGAEKDLSRLYHEVHDRVIRAIRGLASNRRHLPVAASWSGAKTIGASEWAIAGWCRGLRTRFASCLSTVSPTAVKFTANLPGLSRLACRFPSSAVTSKRL